jgi:hypothetical protein
MEGWEKVEDNDARGALQHQKMKNMLSKSMKLLT